MVRHPPPPAPGPAKLRFSMALAMKKLGELSDLPTADALAALLQKEDPSSYGVYSRKLLTQYAPHTRKAVCAAY